MTEEQWVAVILVSIPAVGSLIVSLINRLKLESIHVLVNSRLSELMEATGKVSRAEGVVAGNLDAETLARLVRDAVDEAFALRAGENKEGSHDDPGTKDH